MRTGPSQARSRALSRMRPAGMRSSLLTARPRCGASATFDSQTMHALCKELQRSISQLICGAE